MNEGLRNILCMDEQVFDNLWRKQTRGHLNLSDSVGLCLTLSDSVAHLLQLDHELNNLRSTKRFMSHLP